MRDLFTLDPCVERDCSQVIFDVYGTVGDARNGRFHVRKRTRAGLLRFFVIASADEEFEHVSVSLKHRLPTWEEMTWIAELFFHPEERLVQYRPPASEYVNFHANCLHWWRPLQATLPVPGAWRVGPRPGQSPEEAMEEARAHA